MEHPMSRRLSNEFQPEFVDKFGRLSRDWFEWVARQKNIIIRHKFNTKEKSLGYRHIRVDGWDAQNHTAYQFHWCVFFHRQDSRKTEGCGDVNLVSGKSFLLAP